MTHPQERAEALSDARQLVEALHESKQPLMSRFVRTVAMNVLRHYPQNGNSPNLRRPTSMRIRAWPALARRAYKSVRFVSLKLRPRAR
jgi:hypothetical protein